MSIVKYMTFTLIGLLQLLGTYIVYDEYVQMKKTVQECKTAVARMEENLELRMQAVESLQHRQLNEVEVFVGVTNGLSERLRILEVEVGVVYPEPPSDAPEDGEGS